MSDGHAIPPRPPPSVGAWLARTWATTASRLRGEPAAAAMYAFGKHPAFADFLDVARLPPVPAAFRHFHDTLRPAVERDGGPAEPVLIAWRERAVSAVLWVQPSRDRGDAVTGRFRRCPLLLGVAGPGELAGLLACGGRLAEVATRVVRCDGEGALSLIARTAAEWPGPGVDAADGRVIVAATDAVRRAADGPLVVVARAAGATVHPAALSTLTVASLATWIDLS